MRWPVGLRQWTALARLTAAETLRHPVSLMLTLACVLGILLLPFLIAYELGEEGRLARDGALALHFTAGLFLAGYAACSSLRREIRTGILSTVFSKSVGREVFFLAKFAGVAAVVLLFSVCAAAATLLAQRVAVSTPAGPDPLAVRLILAAPVLALVGAALANYRSRRPFPAYALLYLAFALLAAVALLAFRTRQGELCPAGTAIEWRLLPASLLVALALIVLASIALLLAVRFDTAPTIAITAVIFVVGLLSEYLFGGQGAAWAWLRCLVPDWQLLWTTGALARGGVLPLSYLGPAILYALLYLAGILGIGLVVFRHSELG